MLKVFIWRKSSDR